MDPSDCKMTFFRVVGGCVLDYMWQGVRHKELLVCSALVIIYSWHHIVKTAAVRNDETHCTRLRSSGCLSNINATSLRHCVRVSPQGLSKQCHAGHNQYVFQTSYVAAFCIWRLIIPICPQHESIHNSWYMRPGPGPGLWFREAIDSLAKPNRCSSLVAKLEPCLAACGSRNTGIDLPRNFVTRLCLPVGGL